MAIPREDQIKLQLLFLLGEQPDGEMHCQEAYAELATLFPLLTREEKSAPYSNSLNLWANRVQFAVRHLKEEGLLLHHTMSGGRGIWALSRAGRERLSKIPSAEELLKELSAS